MVTLSSASTTDSRRSLVAYGHTPAWLEPHVHVTVKTCTPRLLLTRMQTSTTGVPWPAGAVCCTTFHQHRLPPPTAPQPSPRQVQTRTNRAGYTHRNSVGVQYIVVGVGDLGSEFFSQSHALLQQLFCFLLFGCLPSAVQGCRMVGIKPCSTVGTHRKVARTSASETVYASVRTCHD